MITAVASASTVPRIPASTASIRPRAAPGGTGPAAPPVNGFRLFAHPADHAAGRAAVQAAAQGAADAVGQQADAGPDRRAAAGVAARRLAFGDRPGPGADQAAAHG